MSDQQTHPARRRVLISISVVVAFVAISTLSILFLQRFAPRNVGSQNTADVQPPVTTAATITKGFTQFNAVSKQVSFKAQPREDATSSFVHVLPGYAYRLYVTTKDFAQFAPKTDAAALNTTQIIADTQAFVAKYGLTKTEIVPAPAEDILDATFTSDAFICHLSPSGTQVYAFACTSTQQLKADYATSAQLIKLYEATLPAVPAYDMATLTTRQDGNKQSAIISLSQSGAAQQSRLLLFAAIDNAWEYIVDLNIGASAKGKYVPTPAVQAKLQNPKYGDFLVKQLQ